jgi:hypothetical protein
MTDRTLLPHTYLEARALEAVRAEDALHWSQAALNLANALRLVLDWSVIEPLARQAINATSSRNALHWSQAALNLANALCLRGDIDECVRLKRLAGK